MRCEARWSCERRLRAIWLAIRRVYERPRDLLRISNAHRQAPAIIHVAGSGMVASLPNESKLALPVVFPCRSIVVLIPSTVTSEGANDILLNRTGVIPSSETTTVLMNV